MGKEQSKSAKRRFNNGKFHNQYFIGSGIDIGAGSDSLAQYVRVFRGLLKVDSWDQQNGDAQYMATVADDTYDFVHSSHCLEHMRNPFTALSHWVRITKPGGYLIITIPDGRLYEHDQWPSRFNGDHKWNFRICKEWGSDSICVMDMLLGQPNIEVHKIELIDDFFNPQDTSDQTRTITTECSIEIVLQKI